MNIDNREKEIEKPEPLRNGLYIIATPIGNLRDITIRALDALKAADLVICEDTRVTGKLLKAYNITAKLQTYNDHSSDDNRAAIVDKIMGGKSVALVSDAGMPVVSDPGYKLVNACQQAGAYITTLPGANAPLSALQLSGMPSDRFSFIGFLPPKTMARKKVLAEWANVKTTLMTFETAPRLLAALKDIRDALGAREVAVVREITKMFEEVKRDNVAGLIEYYEQEGPPKGEIVLVIGPPIDSEIGEGAIEEMVKEALSDMKVKDAAHYVAEKAGRKKSDMYDLALKIKKGL